MIQLRILISIHFNPYIWPTGARNCSVTSFIQYPAASFSWNLIVISNIFHFRGLKGFKITGLPVVVVSLGVQFAGLGAFRHTAANRTILIAVAPIFAIIVTTVRIGFFWIWQGNNFRIMVIQPAPIIPEWLCKIIYSNIARIRPNLAYLKNTISAPSKFESCPY